MSPSAVRNENGKAHGALLLAPLVIAILRLVDDAALDGRLLPPISHLALVAVVGAPVAAAFVRRPGSVRRAAVAACVVAPLSVAGSWAVMPGSVFPASANLRTFLHWLTRYPNLGPVNYEVLLGIACVLLSSFIPWIFATRIAGRAPAVVLHAFGTAQLLSYSAVLWRLDLSLLFIGFTWSLGPSGLHFIAGALARLVGTLGVMYLWSSSASHHQPSLAPGELRGYEP